MTNQLLTANGNEPASRINLKRVGQAKYIPVMRLCTLADACRRAPSSLEKKLPSSFAHDRHVKDASRDPQMDSSQDYRLLLGYENKTHTVLRFSRRYDTCDPRDLKITVSDAIYATLKGGTQDNFLRSLHKSTRDLLSALILH
ncbi:MOXD1-like protein 2 [Acromyrmex echinatior]|uniref:MOXD1-like protein 2 n=1 Tax=Acromyrmex echinatior TaxID=103372 RepID=F4WZ68_ACREC|nr:MOXD1-like protein 2 [Acromyrmex echinatior]